MKVLNKFLKNGTGNYVEVSLTVGLEVGQSDRHHAKPPHDTFKIALLEHRNHERQIK